MNLYRCLAISAIVVLVTAFGVRTSGASAFHEEGTGITTANPALDVNEDGYVDITDLRLVFANAGPPPHSLQRADVNNDGSVNLLDLALVARRIGQSAPLPLEAMDVERAFPSLSFELPTNLVQPDDGPDNLFVTEQAGIIRVFPNDQQASQSSVFLDITDQVTSSSEEGLLGLAFDPDYKNNGLFYVHYPTSSPRRSVVSRFSVSQDDPEMADPSSEFVIMEIDQPFGNHNGGQLAFGPDGYLYIGLGDGGSGGDPLGHGQDPSTLLGSLLRIDVSGVSGDRNCRPSAIMGHI